jgi:hypothetical protein
MDFTSILSTAAKRNNSFQSEPSVQLPQENEARVVAARGLMRIKYSNRTVLRVGTVWQHDEQSEVTIFDKGRRKL